MAFLMAGGFGALIMLLITSFIFENEIGRIARFLNDHDDVSDERLHAGIFISPGDNALVQAINSRFDVRQGEKAASQERSRNFQRSLSGLSKSIRTPLDGARGYVRLAQQSVGKGSVAAGHLDLASAGLDDTVELLDQIVSFAQANDPDAALNLTVMPIKPILLNVLARHRREFEERGWIPEVAFADDDLAAAVDENALARMFDNLAVNALRHGTGTLRVEQVGRTLRFANAVENPGTIDAAKAFEQFYQAEAASDGSGAGLGLAMVAQLARLMGMKATASVAGWEFVVSLELPREVS